MGLLDASAPETQQRRFQTNQINIYIEYTVLFYTTLYQFTIYAYTIYIMCKYHKYDIIYIICIYIYVQYSKSKQKAPSLDLPVSQPLPVPLTCMPIFGSRSPGHETSRNFLKVQKTHHTSGTSGQLHRATMALQFLDLSQQAFMLKVTCESVFAHSIVSSQLIWVLFQSSSIQPLLELFGASHSVSDQEHTQRSPQ